MEGPAVPLKIGTAETLATGDDLCLLAVGSMVAPALECARLLEREGRSVEVVDMRFIKPLDEELLESVWQRHRRVVTIEENAVAGGFGSAVLEWAALRDDRGPRVLNLGIPDAFQEHATRAELLADMGLDASGLADSIRPFADLENKGSQAQSASCPPAARTPRSRSRPSVFSATPTRSSYQRPLRRSWPSPNRPV